MLDYKLSKKRKIFNILKKRYLSKKNIKDNNKIIFNKEAENFTLEKK
jgi:hypothetical protein